MRFLQLVATLAICSFGGAQAAKPLRIGPRGRQHGDWKEENDKPPWNSQDEGSRSQNEPSLVAAVRFWHDVASEVSLRDFSRPEMDPEQPGPTYATRAQTMAHIAIYDALVGVTGEAPSYYMYGNLPSIRPGLVEKSAIGAVGVAAFRVLRRLYSKSTPYLKEARAQYLRTFQPCGQGTRVGRRVAKKVLEDRAGDGADAGPPSVAAAADAATTPPFEHAPDPTATPKQMLHAPHWGAVRPFGFADLNATITPLPDPLSFDYPRNYKDVMRVGGKSSAARTAEQTTIGIWWAYDGAYKVGTPHRLYTQCVDAMIEGGGGAAMGVDTGVGLARVYAALNIVMADATIQCWKEKYLWNFWRPVVAIRRGADDGFPQTTAAPGWTPLGSPATNTVKASTTPSFPAYPSGHTAMGTALFTAAKEILSLPDGFSFTVTSAEFDGVSTNEDGSLRPRLPRKLTIDSAIKENDKSRIYLGVHWTFDCVQGNVLGAEVAHAVVSAFPAKA